MKYILSFLFILPIISFAEEIILFDFNTPEIIQEQTTEISCSPSTYKPEIGSEVYWSAYISSPYVVTIKWKGEGVDGMTNSVVQTSYSKTGFQTVYIEAEYNNEKKLINCGNIEVKKPPLSILCSASKENIKVGDTVKWSTSVSGGSTTPVLQWSGHSEISKMKNDSFNIKYEQPGEYPADLKVTSGNITRTVYCGSVSVSSLYDEPLRVSCNANKSYAYSNDVVNWSSQVSGGKGNYKYTWRGTEPVNELSKNSINIKYSTPGDKYAELEVCSNNDCVITQCGTVNIKDEDETKLDKYTNLIGSCYPNSELVSINEPVLWIAEVNHKISPSLFVWNGTDDLNGLRGESHLISYDNPGIKEASFSIRTDSGELFNFPCLNKVEVNDGENKIGIFSVLKKTILIILISIWTILAIGIIRKKIQPVSESFHQNNLDI